MLKKSLIVGINDYESSPLGSCISDANEVASVIGRDYDGRPNFESVVLTSDNCRITRDTLRRNIIELFNSQVDIALFYFSGHGFINSYGGYLATQDARLYDEGVPMSELLYYANNSRCNNRIIILDCCHSGNMGNDPQIRPDASIINEGVVILSACHQNEYALSRDNKSIFTEYLLDALKGEAADILGYVSPGSIYALVDRYLGAVGQRPIFKANVTQFISLRQCKPSIDYQVLRRITNYFSSEDDEYQLDKEHEPTEPGHVEVKTKIFADLQEYRTVSIVEPIGFKHMYYAAIEGGRCRLTSLGKSYWKGIKNNKI